MSEFRAMGQLDRHPEREGVRRADEEDQQDQMLGIGFEDP